MVTVQQLEHLHVLLLQRLNRYDELMSELSTIATDFNYRWSIQNDTARLDRAIFSLPLELRRTDLRLRDSLLFFECVRRQHATYCVRFAGLSAPSAHQLARVLLSRVADCWEQAAAGAFGSGLQRLASASRNFCRRWTFSHGAQTGALRQLLDDELRLAMELFQPSPPASPAPTSPPAPIPAPPASSEPIKTPPINIYVQPVLPAGPSRRRKQTRVNRPRTAGTPVPPGPSSQDPVSTRPADRSTEPVSAAHMFRWNESISVWEISFMGKRIQLRQMKGLSYIARVIRNAPDAVPVEELVSAGPEGKILASTVVDVAIDQPGLLKIAEQMRELRATAAQASAEGRSNLHETQQLEELENYLKQVATPNGKPKRLAPEREKMRIAVTKAIGESIAAITRADQRLGAHFESSIRRGRLVSYKPPDAVDWQL